MTMWETETFSIATKGCYNIFPNDIHRPGCMVGTPWKGEREVVVKVSMDRVYGMLSSSRREFVSTVLVDGFHIAT